MPRTIMFYCRSNNTEFNMEYPGGYRHNLHAKLVEIIMQSIERERRFV